MMYLAFFDDNAKRSLAEKIAAGAAAYAARFGIAPAVVLLRDAPQGVDSLGGVRLVATSGMQPHMFYFGMEAA